MKSRGRWNYLLIALCLLVPARAVSQGPVTAIVGGTVIDGNGGPPTADAVVLVTGQRITAVGPRASVRIPEGATIVDAKGRYVMPGMIDTNVHLSLYGGTSPERMETLVRYQPRQKDLVLEAAQLDLKNGVTTVRDSYGMLLPLVAVRDSIARGDAVGARILAAGNIVGWGGPFSISFSLYPQKGLTLFEEQINDYLTQGSGEDLLNLTPDELRVAINKYLDKGPNFIKYGGTAHFEQPIFIGFSPDAQKVIVEETHKRGLPAETHSTSLEALKISILAGIDLIQHPEILEPRAMTDELAGMIRDRKIVCSILANSITGEAWKLAMKDKAEAQKKIDEAEKKSGKHTLTSAEQKRRAADLKEDVATYRSNAIKLIKSGCIMTVGTDSYWGMAPEFSREPRPSQSNDHGLGTVIGIEGLVELGMTPAQAIVSATKNGALACRMQKDLGTLEAGKFADIVILDADPLADIHNLRKVRSVMKEGKFIDTSRLPEKPLFSLPPRTGGVL